MLKISLIVLTVFSILPVLAFAAPSIEISSPQSNIGPLDSVLVFGTVTDVKSFSTVNLTVTAPDGEIIFSPNVTFDNEGNFKRLIHPPLPSFKPGVYTIVASNKQLDTVAQIQFTVIGDEIPRVTAQESNYNSGILESKLDSDMHILANAVEGDTNIKITGKTVWADHPVTLKVTSPSGNLITVAQVDPKFSGDFSTTIKIGGQMWKEDGTYTVTAYQGDSSEIVDTVKVEIADGVVVPEFGAIAAMVLAVSIISLIAFSAKSKLSLVTRF